MISNSSRLALAAAAVVALPLAAQSAPTYQSDEARAVVERMVEAHGGMAAWDRVETVDFMFFTKLVGNANSAFLSRETTDVRTGRAYLDWPVLGSRVGWDGQEVWSVGWPLPLPPGFFTRLTYSFITMPFQTQVEPFVIEAPESHRLPNDDTDYVTVRMTKGARSAVMPGDFYRLYIDPESHLLRAIEFNITHPAMMQVPGQPLGPNAHVFTEYARVDDLVIPTYYETYRLFANETRATAIHAVFDLDTNRGFDAERARRPAEGNTDTATMDFWAVSAP
ncbi:MAG: hypothetical protein ABFS34_06450 [Gemmatimonadota bacterium]